MALPDEYWTSVSVSNEENRAKKACYDIRLHQGANGVEFLVEVLGSADLSESLENLRSATERLEQGSKGRLCGTILQLRPAGACRSEQEGKVYFKISFEHLDEMADVLSNFEATFDLPTGELVGEIMRRHEVSPVSFLSVAFRPGLEIETYHDCEESGFESWTLKQLSEIVFGLTQDARAAAISARILMRAEAAGFVCSHISCDLLGDTQDVSLAFDSKTNGVPEDFQHGVEAMCQTEVPFFQELLDAGEEPILISVKVARNAVRSGISAVYLEKALSEVCRLI